MTISAYLGLGLVIQMADPAVPGVKTTMALVFDISSTPFAKFDQVDISTYDQGNQFKQVMAGLADPGTFGFDMNFVPGSATDVYLRANQGAARLVTVTFQNGTVYTFTAIIMEYGWDKAPIDGKMTAICSMEVSGAITFTAAASPVNQVLPSVVGSTLVNGGTFTADEGQWLPAAMSYTYRWMRDGVAIGGATARTYLTVAGDVGHAIQVEVTAINGTGSTVATSLKTGNIT